MNYLAIAKEAAKRAGAVHKKYFRGSFNVRTKSASYDLCTSADTQAEKAVVSYINSVCPGHNFLCEEKNYSKKQSDYTWIIDPLDGTNNFACGIPLFCVSVALRYKNELISGAVYDVMHDELFYAQKDKGAFLNGKRISVNKVSQIKDAMLITGFYYDRGQEMSKNLDAVERFLSAQVLGVRRFGSAALDLSYVACGRAAGFWEFELSPWDFAAGILLVKEAGGKVTGRRGEKTLLTQLQFIVASNSRMHKKMLSVINCKDSR